MCICRDLQFQQSESMLPISYSGASEASGEAGCKREGEGGRGPGGLEHSGNRGSTCSIAHTSLPFLHFMFPKEISQL